VTTLSVRRALRAPRLLTPATVHEDVWVLIDGDRVHAIVPDLPDGWAGEVAIQQLPDDTTLVPGFVDLHCHGGAGASFSDGPAAAVRAVDLHRRHGTTSVMASLVSDTLRSLREQVGALADLVAADELLGVHLEGPWISELHAGAHAVETLADPDLADLASVLDSAPGTVCMVTLASERSGGLRAVEWLVDRGVVAALGHTDASYAETQSAIRAGVRVGTHLFNAQRRFHHREPGPARALLESPSTVVEVIADGVHLHPAVIAEVTARKPAGWVLVTDAMAAAGVGDGSYRLGPQQVVVDAGVARIAGSDGAIAGSTLTLDRALSFVVSRCAVSLVDAVTALTTTPAAVMGRTDIGRIAAGSYADLVVLDAGLAPVRVMRRGRWVEPSWAGD
jgi:N-acetylglucosamine-6-phosphate deacetylase